MSLTVMHLLSVGDGGDGLLRVESLRARPGAPVRHIVGAVGECRGDFAAVAVRPDVRLPLVLGSPAGGALRLLREAKARGVRVVHAWGAPAAELASAAVGIEGRWSGGLRWAASELPEDWRPPAGGAKPELRIEFRPGAAEADTGFVFLPPDAPALQNETAAPTRSAARESLRIPASAPVVLYASPLSPDSDLLTAAWSCSVAAQVYRDLYVLTLGHGTQADKWAGLLKRGTVWPRCRYLSRAADWPTAIAAADVVLDTDLRPMASIAAAMSLGAGLPAVLTDTPIRRALTAGRMAEFCTPGKPREHARAIHVMLADRERVGRSGGSIADDRPAGEDLEQLYLRLAERNG